LDALLSAAANTRWRIGFDTTRQYRHFVYDDAVPHRKDIHELENFRNLLRSLGIVGHHPPTLRRPAVNIKPNRVVVHMFPGGFRSYLKEWPLASWRLLVNALISQGYEIVLTGGTSDKKRAEGFLTTVERPANVSMAVGQTLNETAKILSSASLVVTVNTGIMHMAVALGCRILALHGPTSALRWGPLGNRATAIKSALPCSPCLHLGFDYGCPVNDCMKAISIDEVLAKVNEALQG
jgi:heptosyltransferase I